MIQSGGAGPGTGSCGVRGQEKADTTAQAESMLMLREHAESRGHTPLHLGRAVFTQPMDANANLF